MSIKYKIVKKPNESYEEVAGAVKSAVVESKLHRDYAKKISGKLRGTRLEQELVKTIKKNKDYIKNTTNEKEFKFVNVYSERDWVFFNEFVDDSCGITRYEKEPVKIKVDENYELTNKESLVENFNKIKELAIKNIRFHRNERKSIPKVTKHFRVPSLPFDVTYDVYAGGGNGNNNNNYTLHMVPGEILRLHKSTLLKKIFEPKKPKTNENHVGIEIEFISKSDRSKIANILFKNDLGDYVFLTEDGSLRPEDEYSYAHELTVLLPESKVQVLLRKVIDSLNEAECKVNARCGLHVHLDMRNRDKDVVFNNLVKSQKILFGMNPRQRMDGTRSDGSKDTPYSRPVEFADFKEALDHADVVGGMHARYMGINPYAYAKHKTIEIRIHSGSTNYDKIYNWVCILVNIANETEKHKTEVTKIESFCERFQLNDVLEKHIRVRTDKFNKTGKHITIDEAS